MSNNNFTLPLSSHCLSFSSSSCLSLSSSIPLFSLPPAFLFLLPFLDTRQNERGKAEKPITRRDLTFRKREPVSNNMVKARPYSWSESRLFLTTFVRSVGSAPSYARLTTEEEKGSEKGKRRRRKKKKGTVVRKEERRGGEEKPSLAQASFPPLLSLLHRKSSSA